MAVNMQVMLKKLRPAGVIGKPRERSLARAGHAGQKDEGKCWDGQFHSKNYLRPIFFAESDSIGQLLRAGC